MEGKTLTYDSINVTLQSFAGCFLIVFTYTCITDTCERHISTNEDTNVALATYDMYVFTNMYLLYLSIHLSIYLFIYLSKSKSRCISCIYLSKSKSESIHCIIYLSVHSVSTNTNLVVSCWPGNPGCQSQWRN